MEFFFTGVFYWNFQKPLKLRTLFRIFHNVLKTIHNIISIMWKIVNQHRIKFKLVEILKLIKRINFIPFQFHNSFNSINISCLYNGENWLVYPIIQQFNKASHKLMIHQWKPIKSFIMRIYLMMVWISFLWHLFLHHWFFFSHLIPRMR